MIVGLAGIAGLIVGVLLVHQGRVWERKRERALRRRRRS